MKHPFIIVCAILLPFTSGFSEERNDPFDLESRGLLEEESSLAEEPLFSLETAPAIQEEIIEVAVEQPKIVVEPIQAQIEEKQEVAFNTLEVGAVQTPKKIKSIEISAAQVFSGSPIIYSVLFLMSVFSAGIWIYNFLSLRQSTAINQDLVKALREKFTSNQYDEALGICLQGDNLLCKMVAAGITSRKHGIALMTDAMRAEGKRASAAFWQRTALLNDVAIIAPMLGLLGTVLGMFYAFYDLHRSLESISTLFDGLGISIGTTVAGLVVAILALIFQSTTKYRLVRSLATVENEAKSLSNLLG